MCARVGPCHAPPLQIICPPPQNGAAPLQIKGLRACNLTPQKGKATRRNHTCTYPHLVQSLRKLQVEVAWGFRRNLSSLRLKSVPHFPPSRSAPCPIFAVTQIVWVYYWRVLSPSSSPLRHSSAGQDRPANLLTVCCKKQGSWPRLNFCSKNGSVLHKLQ